MKLLVGLGNPGTEYARHRHNVGFMAVDAIAARHGFSSWRRRFSGVSAEGVIAGERAVLLKPETYMNESGRAVGEAMRFLKIEPADLIVFHDELDIEPARVKVKSGGGNAGHNGLRSISAHIGNDFQRVRIGIGHPGHKDLVSAYVLHDVSRTEADALRPLFEQMADAAVHLAKGKPDAFVKALSPAPESPAQKSSPAEAPRPASARHPSGERQSKRQTALADNLKKWLVGRDPKGD